MEGRPKKGHRGQTERPLLGRVALHLHDPLEATMKLQKFILNMKPYAAPRPRAAYMYGRVRSYMPSKYTKWKQAAVQSFLAQYDGKPFDSPVKIKITFIYRRPKGMCRAKDPRHRLPKGTLPDIDNLAKSTLDALQDAGILANDSLVVSLTLNKYYGAICSDKIPEEDRIEISVEDFIFNILNPSDINE